MLTTMKKTALAAALMATFSFSAFASEKTYEYEGDVYKLEIKSDTISSSYCEKDADCADSSVEVSKLKEKLSSRIELLNKHLADEKKLLDEVEKQATGPDAVEINDEAAGVEYVMVNVGENFSTALMKKDIAEGDFSLIPRVMKAETERLGRALAMLESGTLPDGGKFEDYDKIAPVMELENLVRFSQYM